MVQFDLKARKTKALSKAARRRLKRGRPREPAGLLDREPNGKLSRRKAATEGRVMDVVLNRRIRQQGIIGDSDEPIEKQAADPRRGYVLGILLLGSRVSLAQHDAGLRYASDMGWYFRTAGLKFPSPRAHDMFSIRGGNGSTAPDTADQALSAAAARRRAMELRDVLLATGDIDTGRRVEHTVRAVCLLDQPDSEWAGRSLMAGLLVRGLNSLTRYYGMTAA